MYFNKYAFTSVLLFYKHMETANAAQPGNLEPFKKAYALKRKFEWRYIENTKAFIKTYLHALRYKYHNNIPSHCQLI